MQSADPITARPEGATTVVVLRGEIDVSVREHAGRALAEVATGDRPVVIDLGAVTFMDSTGVAFLLQCLRVAQEAGRSCSVRDVPVQVAQVLRVLGLAALFPVADPAVATAR